MQRIILSLLVIFLYCCTPPDAEYEKISNLKGQERLAEFRKYNLKTRFRLYEIIYKRSGHPRDDDLSTEFRDRPHESLEYISNNLKNGDFGEFLMYMPIIYDIGMNSNIKICATSYMKSMQRQIVKYDLDIDQKRAISVLKFDDCDFLGMGSKSKGYPFRGPAIPSPR